MPGLDEFEIIARYFSRQPGEGVILGVGDDAAILDVDEPIVVAVDTIVGGVHFPPDLRAHAIGYRALAVNLSDLAAMGAKPRWATLALTLPAADESWLEGFAAGFFELATQFGVGLVGGDTTRGPLTASVQLIGTLPSGQALRRSGGRAGDDVYVTGTLGDAAGALPLLARGGTATEAETELIARFECPSPRVDAGLKLASVAAAAIDVSDGLVADLGHICRQSGCGARIDLERLPLSRALRGIYAAERAVDFALGGGDDYELCFTAPRKQAAAVAAALAECATPFTRIGELVTGNEVVFCRGGRPVALTVSGYTHF